jgi:UDP-N-acetylmuramyl pentapeptide phosphotransferase/UDP-N-acetylglucosamine-1-phosphate transferase
MPKATKSAKPVVKATKAVKAAKKVEKIEIPGLIGLAFLLGLLCLLPWVSGLNGGRSFHALQVSLALILALAGGICLGLQIAANKKK